MDFGYPHPDDMTPEVLRMLEADEAMDEKRSQRESHIQRPPLSEVRPVASLKGLGDSKPTTGK